MHRFRRSGPSVTFEPIGKYDYADVMTIGEFIHAVEHHAFVDYDGDGYLATEQLASDWSVKSSDFHRRTGSPPLSLKTLPEWVTHVVWFNK